MRIREIIHESFKLPVQEYKAFLTVIFLAIIGEIKTSLFYSIRIKELSLVILIINSLITIIILGLMISITNNAVNKKEVNYFDFIENLNEGIKEYILTLYYLFLSVIFSSVFIVPTGVYSHLLHIHEYMLKLDINTTLMTLHDVSHEIPYLLKIDLTNSLQLNLIINMFICVIFISFSFIGKIILTKTGDLSKSVNPKIIYKIIRNIGFKRYSKFVIITGITLIMLVNVLIQLEYLFSEVLFSALLEALILFFATKSFHEIIENT